MAKRLKNVIAKKNLKIIFLFSTTPQYLICSKILHKIHARKHLILILKKYY